MRIMGCNKNYNFVLDLSNIPQKENTNLFDWKNSVGKIDYVDSLGVFDLNRKKIVECLVKNHDFNENSEVGEYKRKLVL